MKQYPGVVIAIVKNLHDPEGQGRIEVQFPWLSDSLRSSWAPVAAPLAGKQRGMFFMPEVDDEVLVAFEHGSFNHPYVVGYLWNGKDIPPEVATLYQHMCPAGVYERDGDRLVVSPANCIDCKATDVIGPRWTPREGESGPRYRLM